MAMLSFAGIDVSKDRLDVVVLPEEECSSVPNAAGWAELIEQLHGFSVSAIGIEASGGYERGVMHVTFPGDDRRPMRPALVCSPRAASGALSGATALLLVHLGGGPPPAPEGEPQRPRTAWRPLLLPRAESSWAHSLY